MFSQQKPPDGNQRLLGGSGVGWIFKIRAPKGELTAGFMSAEEVQHKNLDRA